MINKTELKDLLPKWWSIVFWICIGLVFFGNRLNGQTYTVGDTVGNFGATICENDSGYWDYHVSGLGNVTWLNLFTSW
jgi:hypothetical protein